MTHPVGSSPGLGPGDESWPMIEEAVLRLFGDIAVSHTVIGPPLAELGWSDIEAEYPVEAAELLFRAQGKTLSHTDCLDRAILAELSGVVGDADAVILPALGRGHQPEPRDGGVRGLVTGPLRGTLAVPVALPSGAVAIGVVGADGLAGRRLDTFDPSVEWAEVSGPPPADFVEATDAWGNAVAAAHRGVATELTALTTRILEIATDLASARVQFGAPIGSFQALRHALAEAAATLAGAQSLLDEAWRFGGGLLAMIAKAAAGQAHRAVSAAALQACGAIGLTAEHDLHRYVRRGFQIDSLFGSYRELESSLAERTCALPAGQGLPRVIACG